MNVDNGDDADKSNSNNDEANDDAADGVCVGVVGGSNAPTAKMESSSAASPKCMNALLKVMTIGLIRGSKKNKNKNRQQEQQQQQKLDPPPLLSTSVAGGSTEDGLNHDVMDQSSNEMTTASGDWNGANVYASLTNYEKRDFHLL